MPAALPALPPLPGSDRDLRSCTCARPQASRRRERQIVPPPWPAARQSLGATADAAAARRQRMAS